MKYSKIEQTVIDTATPIAADVGCFIYDVEYIKEAGVRFLRVYADKRDSHLLPGNKITLDECEVISRKLSDLLDESELIDENYYLEVSSPGAARRLKTPEHFEMYIGRLVEVSLYKAINDTKKLLGMLVSHNDGEVVVEIDGEELTLKKEDYGKVSLYFDINEVLKNSKNNDSDGRNSGK